MTNLEAIVLTGGASRRMGTDKAKLIVDGEPLAERVARLIAGLGIPVTIAGREPIPGHNFLGDAEDFAGPLAALARFQPSAEYVFVASCDLPGFDPSVIESLRSRIGEHAAAVPSLDGRLQPLCALYSAPSFELARGLAVEDERRTMAWLERLDYVVVDDIEPAFLANVNTQDEFKPFQRSQ